MINIQNLSFRYSVASNYVFSDFSLHIGDGNIIGLLGKNGTGKSTLLYLISGLLHPTKGEVCIDGIPSNARRPEMLSEVFIVPEEFDLPSISLEAYIDINLPFYPRLDRELLYSNLQAFELPTDLNLGQLSMGQKKKVYMSFALAAGTRLLLMDEPTNGLDIPSKMQFRKVVTDSMRPDRTIIISTHQVHDVEMLISHVIMLDGQQLLVNESTEVIQRLIAIEHRPYGTDLSDAFYAEPTVGGHAVVAPSKGQPVQNDIPLNLELLFNALLLHPGMLQDAAASTIAAAPTETSKPQD